MKTTMSVNMNTEEHVDVQDMTMSMNMEGDVDVQDMTMSISMDKEEHVDVQDMTINMNMERHVDVTVMDIAIARVLLVEKVVDVVDRHMNIMLVQWIKKIISQRAVDVVVQRLSLKKKKIRC